MIKSRTSNLRSSAFFIFPHKLSSKEWKNTRIQILFKVNFMLHLEYADTVGTWMDGWWKQKTVLNQTIVSSDI